MRGGRASACRHGGAAGAGQRRHGENAFAGAEGSCTIWTLCFKRWSIWRCHNLDFMLQTLVNLALHYPQAGRTPAQLRILAEDWAEDLAAFPRDIVERAVKAHRRESPYFPTVADIWRRCEELRRGLEARREAERALPGRTLTRDEQIALNTDWCAKILENLRGKMERGKRGGCGRAG